MEDQQILSLFAESGTRHQGFTLLVKKYQQKVYWLVRKMVVDHDDAADLTQDIFVKVWHNLESFRADAKLYTWIYRVATNECLSFLEKKKRMAQDSLEGYEESLASQLENDPLVTGEEIQILLQQAILTLPEKQRLVFHLKYFEEMKYEDMSDVLGTSVGALKASYHLAVKKIEQFIRDRQLA